MSCLPTLRQLRLFTALVRSGSFSAAAAECCVSQSTLSSAIREMERLTGSRLVDRSTRSFSLTAAGEQVAARAGPILVAARDLVRVARGGAPLDGPFRLGAIPTVAPFLLPGVLPALRDAYPALRLYLREDLTDALVERLSSGTIDAALLAFPYHLDNMDHMEFATDPFWFVCGRDHAFAGRARMTPEDLRGCDLLLLEDGHCLREQAIEACSLVNQDFSSAFAGTSLLTLVQMVRAGLGATLIPQMALREEFIQTSGLVAIPFEEPAPSRRIGIAWRRGSGNEAGAGMIAEVFTAPKPAVQEKHIP